MRVEADERQDARLDDISTREGIIRSSNTFSAKRSSNTFPQRSPGKTHSRCRRADAPRLPFRRAGLLEAAPHSFEILDSGVLVPALLRVENAQAQSSIDIG